MSRVGHSGTQQTEELCDQVPIVKLVLRQRVMCERGPQAGHSRRRSCVLCSRHRRTHRCSRAAATATNTATAVELPPPAGGRTFMPSAVRRKRTAATTSDRSLRRSSLRTCAGEGGWRGSQAGGTHLSLRRASRARTDQPVACTHLHASARHRNTTQQPRHLLHHVVAQHVVLDAVRVGHEAEAQQVHHQAHCRQAGWRHSERSG